jgi:hypothetical protein
MRGRRRLAVHELFGQAFGFGLDGCVLGLGEDSTTTDQRDPCEPFFDLLSNGISSRLGVV